MLNANDKKHVYETVYDPGNKCIRCTCIILFGLKRETIPFTISGVVRGVSGIQTPPIDTSLNWVLEWVKSVKKNVQWEDVEDQRSGMRIAGIGERHEIEF